jgi:hypothetical protein
MKRIQTGKPAAINQAPKKPATDLLVGKIQARRAEILFHDVVLTEEEGEIAANWSRPSLVDTATDGSFDAQYGIMAYGWVIAVNERVIAKGKGPAEAHPDLAEPFRAKAYGLASASAFIQLIIQHFSLFQKSTDGSFILIAKPSLKGWQVTSKSVAYPTGIYYQTLT